MAQSTAHCYVVTDEHILGGEPVISGTRTPVRAIVELWQEGIPPVDIPAHLPHLTLAQIFDGLSYYFDHTAEIQRHIVENRIPPSLIDSTAG